MAIFNKVLLGTASLLAASLVSPLSASAATMTVDTELFLSIDISGSVDSTEYNLQRQGWVNAFQQTEVQDAIKNSTNGIAVGVSLWGTQDTVQEIAWTHLTNQMSIDNFIATLASLGRNSSEGGTTCVACGIEFGVNAILNNDFISNNLILDISGDGVDNVRGTAAVQVARDNAAANGITINGLAIGGLSITDYYINNVKTADGFVMSAADFSVFEDAAKEKIKTEIIGPNPNPTVPEPSSVVSLLAFGLLGTKMGMRKHRQQRH